MKPIDTVLKHPTITEILVKSDAKSIVYTGKNLDVKMFCLHLINASTNDAVKQALTECKNLISVS